MNNRILIVGNWKWAFYEEAIAYGFEQNGWYVQKYVTNYLYESLLTLKSPLKQLTTLHTINSGVLSFLEKNKVDIIFFYRGGAILPSTVKKIKKRFPNTVIIFYHNDNPYKNNLKIRLKYYSFLKCLKYADITYVYRPQNIDEASKYSKSQPKLLMPYYYSKTDLEESVNQEEKKFDLIYIGHYENDAREKTISELYKNDIKLHVFGPEWNEIFKKNHWPVEYCHGPVYNREEYKSIINSSCMSLVFLSKRNRDVYTRRNFEIPACGGLMVTPKSPELYQIFEDSVIYYDGNEDLVNKIKMHLMNKQLLYQKTKESHERVLTESEYYRAKQIINDVRAIQCLH